MWQHIEQSALALSMNFRYTRHRVWEEKPTRVTTRLVQRRLENVTRRQAGLPML